MEDFKLVGPNGTDVNEEFLKAYRDSLKNQYDASVSSLVQQKRNNDASIMSSANEAGMMYSNFPQRSKIQSEAQYLTNLSKLHSTYQTGLDKLRNNAVDVYNQIKSYEEAIADLNGASGGSGGGTGGSNGTGGGGTGGTGGTGGGDNGTTGDNENIAGGEIPTIAYNDSGKNSGYSDAGWSNSNWDRQVAESNGKYSDWLIFPDWLERGVQTGEWYFGNSRGKG